MANEIRYLTTDTPDDPAVVPGDATFSGHYQDAPELRRIGELLISHQPHLAVLRDYGDLVNIRYVWGRKAAQSNGKTTLGHAQRVSGLTHHLTGAVFAIEIAAETARNLTQGQLEALMFHELLHCTIQEGKKGPKPAMVGHDLEMFYADVDAYGLWLYDLRLASKTFARQMGLDLSPDEAPADRPGAADADIVARVRRFQDLADQNGTTMTLTGAGKSVTVGPLNARYDADTDLWLNDQGDAYASGIVEETFAELAKV